MEPPHSFVVLFTVTPILMLLMFLAIFIFNIWALKQQISPTGRFLDQSDMILDGETPQQAADRIYRVRISQRVNERIAEESQTGRGQPVWVSHHVSGGQFKHWTLLTHGYKYELRRKQTASRRETGVELAGLNPRRRPNLETLPSQLHARSLPCFPKQEYVYNVVPSTIDEETRRQAIRTTLTPIVHNTRFGEGFCISMIGWTSKTKNEIDAICESTMADFGKYSLVFNNCQHFLRKLSEAVVQDRSHDWDWFYKSTIRSYRWLKPPEKEPWTVLATHWIRSMEASLPGATQEEQAVIQNKIDRLGTELRAVLANQLRRQEERRSRPDAHTHRHWVRILRYTCVCAFCC